MKLPFNLIKWIQENKNLLKPPVGNKVLLESNDFIVMAVGGPNKRDDFHINKTEEIFFQLEGSIILKTINKDNVVEDILINPGELFLLPGGVPHCPQRPESTIGIVIEKREDEKDIFQWRCHHCHHVTYQETISVKDIEKDLPVVFSNYSEFKKGKNCSNCQTTL